MSLTLGHLVQGKSRPLNFFECELKTRALFNRKA